jgi:hypothetical protein
VTQTGVSSVAKLFGELSQTLPSAVTVTPLRLSTASELLPIALVWPEAGNSSGSAAAQAPNDTTSATSTNRIEVPHSFGIRRCMIACFRATALHGELCLADN